MTGQMTDPLAVIQWMLAQSLATDEAPQTTLFDWQRSFEQAARPWASSLDRAIIGGFIADRLAWALAAGYGEAIRSLLPDMPSGTPAALCVTESGGNHPRAINTRLEPVHGRWTISGTKTFVTGADTARLFLVAATTGMGEDGRPRLRLVRLPADARGVTVASIPDLPFVPEISHGTLTLETVRVDPQWVLPGDGYLCYIKPFRTIEDTHVLGAVMGYLARIALACPWPTTRSSELFALITALGGLWGKAPLLPHGHIVLGGIWSQMETWLQSAAGLWNETDPETRHRWIRDRPLLNVAQKARTRRLETAWQHFLSF